MKRTTLVLITAAGLTATGAAQATDVDIYGQARLHLNYIDNGASGDDAYSAASVSTNASVLGFRAEHELSDRLTGIVQIEGQVNLTNNAAANERFTFRDSFVGLDGAAGLFRVGRYDTPVKLIRTRTDLFGNQIGDARNLMRNDYDGQGFDDRLRSSL